MTENNISEKTFEIKYKTRFKLHITLSAILKSVAKIVSSPATATQHNFQKTGSSFKVRALARHLLPNKRSVCSTIEQCIFAPFFPRSSFAENPFYARLAFLFSYFASSLVRFRNKAINMSKLGSCGFFSGSCSKHICTMVVFTSFWPQTENIKKYDSLVWNKIIPILSRKRNVIPFTTFIKEQRVFFFYLGR